MSKVKLASSVILSRGQGADTEVFLCLRAPELRFFGGYWVFPGGNLDNGLDVFSGDESLEPALRRCAVRELLEEVNVLSSTLGESFTAERKVELRSELASPGNGWREFISGFDPAFPRLQSILRITTPPFIPLRFDTQFFHVRTHDSDSPTVDKQELLEGQFIRPADAIKAWEQGEMDIAPPVLFLLRLLATHGMDDFANTASTWEERLEEGALHQAYFSPGIFMAPLQTPTLPPATTTNTLIIGTQRLYVVDPATPDETEQDRLIRHMEELQQAGHSFEAILLTHHHSDHVGAVNRISQYFKLAVRAHEKCYERIEQGFIRGDALKDGDRLELGDAPDGSPGWHLQVLHTPGHAIDHLCFIDSRYNAAVIGDMLSTLSTIVIDPPEGHMRTYLDQLERLGQLPLATVFPSHGPPRRDGVTLIREFLAHRREREKEIVTALSATAQKIDELLPVIYSDVPREVYPIASRSLLAGLIKLEEEGLCVQDQGAWRLA